MDTSDNNEQGIRELTEFDIFPFEADIKTALKKLEIHGGPRLTRDQVHRFLDIHLEHQVLGGFLGLRTKADAANTQLLLHQMQGALKKTLRQFRELKAVSAQAVTFMERAFLDRYGLEDVFPYPDEAIEEGQQLFIESFIQNQLRMVQRLEKAIKSHRRNGEESRGPTPDIAARNIAVAIAEIYLELRNGEKPSAARKGEDGNLPGTPFTQAVADVFAAMDIQIGFRSPCEYAVAQIEAKPK